jgi:hypothetical protein
VPDKAAAALKVCLAGGLEMQVGAAEIGCEIVTVQIDGWMISILDD